MSALPAIDLLLSKLAFLAGLLWSFWGAGRLLTRSLNFGAPAHVATAAPAVLIGAAFVIAFSGYMLSIGCAGPWSLAAVLAVFALSTLCPRPSLDILQATQRVSAPLLMLAMLVVTITALYVWLPPSFNGGDDSPGYYVFVREISVLGELSPQPFSERRLYTLGGHFPLAALSDYWFGPDGMSIIDPGLGLALVGIFLISQILRGATRASAAAVVLAILAGQLAIGSPIKNTVRRCRFA